MHLILPHVSPSLRPAPPAPSRAGAAAHAGRRPVARHRAARARVAGGQGDHQLHGAAGGFRTEGKCVRVPWLVQLWSCDLGAVLQTHLQFGCSLPLLRRWRSQAVQLPSRAPAPHAALFPQHRVHPLALSLIAQPHPLPLTPTSVSGLLPFTRPLPHVFTTTVSTPFSRAPPIRPG